MTSTHNALGQIDVSPHALATVASQAVLSTYGVVGLAPKNAMEGITNILTRDPRHGVEVIIRPDGQINFELYIIIEYGTRIATVADSVANNVRFSVETAFQLHVNSINVHVQGLRISHTDA